MRRIMLQGVLIGLTLSASAIADQLILHDGSRIVGTIERVGGGKVVIVTDFAGKLEFDSAKVKSITTDAAVNVSLQSGDRLVGSLESSPDAAQSTVKSAVGDVNLGMDNLAYLWPQGSESPEEAAANAKYKPSWLYRVEFGGSQTEGNTDTRNIRGRLDINRKTSKDLLRFYAQADYSEQDDVRSRQEYIGGMMYEFQFLPRWFWYARGELENDEFEDLDLRATVATGVGYYWIQKEDHELKTRLGGGYRYEDYESGNSRDDVIADAGLDYRKDVTKWMQFLHSTTYSPSLEDFDDYRLDFNTALLFPLKADQWKLKVGMENKYNSNPSGDLDRLDNLYYVNVLLDIKR